MFVPHCSGVSLFRHSYLAVGASKGTPGDAKCVAEILEGDKIYRFISRENKRIKVIKQSNNLSINRHSSKFYRPILTRGQSD